MTAPQIDPPVSLASQFIYVTIFLALLAVIPLLIYPKGVEHRAKYLAVVTSAAAGITVIGMLPDPIKAFGAPLLLLYGGLVVTWVVKAVTGRARQIKQARKARTDALVLQRFNRETGAS